MQVYKFKRGQIWWYTTSATNFDGNIQGKTRPYLIVSNDKANFFSNVLIGVPLTSQDKSYLPTHAKFKINDTLNVALCENITSLNIQKLTSYIGTVDDEILTQIDCKLKIALGLEGYPENSEQLKNERVCSETTIKNVIPTEVKPAQKNVDLEQINIIKRKRSPNLNFSVADKIRFINDAETHDSDYMFKKYTFLKTKQDIAKRKYAFRKQLELDSKESKE